MSGPLFEPGTIALTDAFTFWLAENNGALSHRVISDALRRHLSGDCGDMPPEDKETNREAIILGNRVHSVYPCDPLAPAGRKFWVITEADRSATTFLFPEDY